MPKLEVVNTKSRPRSRLRSEPKQRRGTGIGDRGPVDDPTTSTATMSAMSSSLPKDRERHRRTQSGGQIESEPAVRGGRRERTSGHRRNTESMRLMREENERLKRDNRFLRKDMNDLNKRLVVMERAMYKAARRTKDKTNGSKAGDESTRDKTNGSKAEDESTREEAVANEETSSVLSASVSPEAAALRARRSHAQMKMSKALQSLKNVSVKEDRSISTHSLPQSARSEISGRDEYIRHLKKERDMLQQKCLVLEKERAADETEILGLQRELTRSLDTEEELERNYEDVIARNSELGVRLQELREEYEQKNGSLYGENDSDAADLKEELSKKIERICILELELEMAHEEVQELKSRQSCAEI